MNPIRCCMACRSRKNKEELFRIVADENKQAIVDREQKVNSRGMYICKDTKCINNIIKGIEKNKVKLKYEINGQSLLEVLKELGEEIWEK